MPSKFFEARVVKTQYFTPEILKITFRAILGKIDFFWEWVVIIRVGANDWRHYTLCSFNRDIGLFEIILYIHGGDPGSKLADKLDLELECFNRTPDSPAQQAIMYLREFRKDNFAWKDLGVFYLTGNVTSVQAFRKELNSKYWVFYQKT